MSEPKRILRQLPKVLIYPQPYWHQEAEVIGNRAGLEALRDAITRALGNGLDEAEVYCTDGEGYGITVLELCDELLDEMPLPYTDDDAKQQDRSWPQIVRESLSEWKRERYAALSRHKTKGE